MKGEGGEHSSRDRPKGLSCSLLCSVSLAGIINPRGLYVPIWHTWFPSVIPALKKLRQGDSCKVKASLGYIKRSRFSVRPHLKELEVQDG